MNQIISCVIDIYNKKKTPKLTMQCDIEETTTPELTKFPHLSENIINAWTPFPRIIIKKNGKKNQKEWDYFLVH